MPLKRSIRWTLIGLAWTAITLVLTFATLYMLASWQPGAYAPPQLTQEQKDDWAHDFVGNINDFNNKVGAEAEPFTWELSTEVMNYYLASMDQIVAFYPGRQFGEVQAMLDTAGVEEPMVLLDKDRMTVMIRSNEYGMVGSADIRIRMMDDERIKVSLESARIGLLPVPRIEVQRRLRQFKAAFQDRLDRLHQAPAGRGDGGISMPMLPFDRVLATLILAIDEKPLPTRFEISNRWVRIEDISISDNQLTLTLVPEAPEDSRDEGEDDGEAPLPETEQSPSIAIERRP